MEKPSLIKHAIDLAIGSRHGPSPVERMLYDMVRTHIGAPPVKQHLEFENGSKISFLNDPDLPKGTAVFFRDTFEPPTLAECIRNQTSITSYGASDAFKDFVMDKINNGELRPLSPWIWHSKRGR